MFAFPREFPKRKKVALLIHHHVFSIRADVMMSCKVKAACDFKRSVLIHSDLFTG